MKLRVKIFYLRKKYFETFIKKKGRIAFNGLFGNHQSRRFGSGSLEHCLEWHLVQKLKPQQPSWPISSFKPRFDSLWKYLSQD